MLAILLPHLFEDVEYLLPDGMDVDMLNGDLGDWSDEDQVAGPSRLA